MAVAPKSPRRNKAQAMPAPEITDTPALWGADHWLRPAAVKTRATAPCPQVTALESEACRDLDLTRRPVGRVQLLDAIEGIRVGVALDVECIEGIDVEAEAHAFVDREDLVRREAGNVVEPAKHRCLPEGMRASRAGIEGSQHRGAVAQRNQHVVGGVVRDAGRIVDRRLVRNVVRRRSAPSCRLTQSLDRCAHPCVPRRLKLMQPA